MTRYKVIALLASFLLLPCIAIARGKTIYTSSVKNWTPASLEQLVNECEEGSTIVFDADYDYTIDRCIKPKVSISIKGKGKILRCINQYKNCVISLFDVQDVLSFKLEGIVIDGNCDVYGKRDFIPKEFLITIKDVSKVSIKNCSFNNIWTSFPNWKPGDEVYTIWVENFDRFTFEGNTTDNCRCSEFLKAVQPIDNNSQKKIAVINNNILNFVSTSSAIEVRFCRYAINYNEIGFTHGSSINAFGFDSEIIGNKFGGSHDSSSIDLSEQFFFKYISHNVRIKDNYSDYSRYGFLMADTVHDITIRGNTFRADIVNENDYFRYNRLWTPLKQQCDKAIILNGNISNILICSNHFEGANALMALNNSGSRHNIRIENNYLRNVFAPIRSSLVINQVDGITIYRNTFINTGYTFSYLDTPQFIVIGPSYSENSSDRYVKNLTISKNRFVISNADINNAYILAHTVYDPNNCGMLSSLDNIIVKKNNCNVRGDILLVSDDFSSRRDKASISIRGNQFNGGGIQGNLVDDDSIIPLRRGSSLDANTYVTFEGVKYYVVIGGTSSYGHVSYDDVYIKDGSAILRRIE